RVPDGQHESQARSQDRDDLHDDRRGLLLHLEPLRARRRAAGWRRRGPGAAAGAARVAGQIWHSEAEREPQVSARVSQRCQANCGSSTMAIAARALALRSQGRDIVSLSVGEPDFPLFPHVAQAVQDAVRAGKTKYTQTAGTPELREAIAAWMQR